MLAESLLEIRVLKFVCEKSSEPGLSPGIRTEGGGRRTAIWQEGMPYPGSDPFKLLVSPQKEDPMNQSLLKKMMKLTSIHGMAIAGSLPCFDRRGACGQETHPEPAEIAWVAGPADQEEDSPSRPLDGTYGEGRIQWPCLDVGLHLRWNHQGRIAEDAHDP